MLWLTFDGGAPDAVPDASDNHNDGRATNVLPTQGPVGNAALFNGADSFVQVADAPSLDQLTGALTMEAWVNPAAPDSTGYFVTKNRSWLDRMPFLLGLKNGTVRAVLENQRYDTDVAVAVGTWSHVALTWDGAEYRIYVNGDEQASGRHTLPLTPNNHPLVVGARNRADGGATYHFHGALDELQVWAEARLPSQICEDAGRLWDGMHCVDDANGTPAVVNTSYELTDFRFHGFVHAEDPDGDPVTFRIETQPANGTVRLDADSGEFFYQAGDEFGAVLREDSFTFVASDSQTDSAPATVHFSVPDDSYEENDYADEAFDLTPFPDQWLSAIAGPGISLDMDTFAVTVDEPGTLTVESQNAEVEIWLESSLHSTSGGVNVGAGTHILYVRRPAAPGAQYDFKWEFVADRATENRVDAYEGNDASYTSFNMSTLRDQWLSSINGPAFQTDVDWYDLGQTREAGTLTVEVSYNRAVDGRQAAVKAELCHGFLGSEGPLPNGEYEAEIIVDESSCQPAANTGSALFLEAAVSRYDMNYLRITGDNAGNSYDVRWRFAPETAADDQAATFPRSFEESFTFP